MVALALRRPVTTTGAQNKRLSEVAKHLASPTALIAGSMWPDVRKRCVDDMGLEFDRWQDGVAGLILAYGADANLVHTVGGIGLSICRQTGKTHTVASVIFGLCVEMPGLLVIWTAHHSKTSDETFLAMQGFAARTRVEPFIEKIYTGSGDEEIRFHNGSRILFGARERGFGRGIPGVDVIVNDEAQILSEKAMQNMLATMNTSHLGLHIYMGTPPTPNDNSEMWLGMRKEALDAEKTGVEVTDIVWIEFGADDGAKSDDETQYPKMNPSFPHRTPLASIKRLHRRLGEDGFRREAMGLYDEEASAAIDMVKWGTLVDYEVEAPYESSLAIAVSPDRRWTTLGIVGDGPAGKRVVLVESVKGTDLVVKRVEELRKERYILDVSFPGSSSAKILKGPLTAAGIDFYELSETEMAAGYGVLQEGIKHSQLLHVDQPELNFALENTQTRMLNTGTTESFDLRGVHVNVSPAVAVAAALYRWGLLEHGMPVIL